MIESPERRTATGQVLDGARAGEPLARFAERRGVPVFEALGTWWVRRNRHLFLSLPPERELALDAGEVAQVLWRRRLPGMQYTVGAGVGTPVGFFVCRTRGFTLAQLTKTRRARVRKGQALAQLRRLDPDELLAQGLELNLETLARQRRCSPEFMEPARWARFVAAVRATPEVSVYGAFVDGRLATYALTCRDGPWVHGLFKMQRTEDLRRNTSCALDAWVLCELARDPGVEVLVNGLALGEADPLYEYKRSLGFEVLARGHLTQLHPALGLVARPALARAAGALSARLPRLAPLRQLAQVSADAALSRAVLAGGAAAPEPEAS